MVLTRNTYSEQNDVKFYMNNYRNSFHTHMQWAEECRPTPRMIEKFPPLTPSCYSRTFLGFMESEGSLPRSQDAATCSYPEPDESKLHPDSLHL